MNGADKRMTLSELLPEMSGQLAADGLAELKISGLASDSRRIADGDLFLACKGDRFDGADFISRAEQAGAVAVLIGSREQVPECGLPLIVVDGLETRLAELADRFYGQPSRHMTMIGITGTNGKTSCSHFIARALELLDSPAAVIGTNGYGFLDRLQSASHTTPDPLRLQALLAGLQGQGAENLVMEVSSHALDQGRVAGIAFSQAVFTNLTRDHLDYHGDMASYGAAKQRLFRDYGIRQAVINLDDPYARELLKAVAADVEIIGYGLEASPLVVEFPNLRQLLVREHQLSVDGLAALLDTPWGDIRVKAPVLGRFNLSNLMATVAVLGNLGTDAATIERILPQLRGVEGRMQPLPATDGRLVVVDYAHTPDALEKALRALRSHCQGQLWCVFGCGGDRDRGKRAEMATIAGRLADRPVVTSDNPRTEDPQQIINEVLSGFSSCEGVAVEADRRQAIALALSGAEPGDVVLVAGKGHEDYQEINGVRYPFSDAGVIRSLLETGGERD